MSRLSWSVGILLIAACLARLGWRQFALRLGAPRCFAQSSRAFYCVGRVEALAWRPDGLALAVTHARLGENGCTLWDPITGRQALANCRDGARIVAAAFTPGGRQVVLASGDGVEWWDTRSNRPLRRFRWCGTHRRVVAVSPNGQRAATDLGNPRLQLWDFPPGRSRRVSNPLDYTCAAAFSRSGALLALGGLREVVVLDGESGALRQRQPIPGVCGGLWTLAFSPDDKFLVTGDQGGTLQVYDLRAGRLLWSVKASAGDIRALAVSPDGRSVASASTRAEEGSQERVIRLWEARTGARVAEWPAHADTIDCLAFSPNGLTLASGSSDGTVRLWRFRGGRMIPGTARICREIGESPPLQ